MRWGKDKRQGPASLVIGAPVAGTEGAVAEIDDRDDGAWSGLAAADSAFDAATFLGWARGAYDRSGALWASRDAEPLRPVMEASVFDRYAQEVLSASSLPGPRSFAMAATATARLGGANAGGAHHNAVAVFDATVADASLCSTWGLPADQARWVDRWLFQRPTSCSTPVSGAVVVCPECGAPATDGSPRCRYCGADVSAQTGGWLVTRVETTMPWLAVAEDRLAALRERMADKMAEKLPPLPTRPSGPVLQPPRAAPPA
jgi:hypothetical protein